MTDDSRLEMDCDLPPDPYRVIHAPSPPSVASRLAREVVMAVASLALIAFGLLIWPK